MIAIPVTAIVIALIFFVPEIQVQAATSSSQRRLYSDLHLSTNACSKPLYLRCRLDTAADVNVMPISVCKKLFYDYSLSKLRPVQASVIAYNSTNIAVIESGVLYHNSETLTFNTSDLESS